MNITKGVVNLIFHKGKCIQTPKALNGLCKFGKMLLLLLLLLPSCAHTTAIGSDSYAERES